MHTCIYQRVLELFQERLDDKTSWGKNELKTALADCMQQAVKESHNGNQESN